MRVGERGGALAVGAECGGPWLRRGGSDEDAPPQHDVISSSLRLSSNGAFNPALSTVVRVFTLGVGMATSTSCGGSSFVLQAPAGS